jgi:hypothetical protein
MNGHLEIAGADPLFYDLFELTRRFRLLVHALSLNCFANDRATATSFRPAFSLSASAAGKEMTAHSSTRNFAHQRAMLLYGDSFLYGNSFDATASTYRMIVTSGGDGLKTRCDRHRARLT